MVASALPLSNPCGTVRAVPCRPSMAMRSMFGVRAASIGVSPPSSLRGSSAAPSGMMIAYFMMMQEVFSRGKGDQARGEIAACGFAVCCDATDVNLMILRERCGSTSRNLCSPLGYSNGPQPAGRPETEIGHLKRPVGGGELFL